ncbi:MAG: hypothetical protein ACKOOL_09515 [Novosphingobium sp.]
MTLDWANVIGMIGSILVVIGFAYANQVQQLNRFLFNGLNLSGAVLLLVSLSVHFNLAAFVLEAIWALIATLGLLQTFIAQRRDRQ